MIKAGGKSVTESSSVVSRYRGATRHLLEARAHDSLGSFDLSENTRLAEEIRIRTAGQTIADLAEHFISETQAMNSDESQAYKEKCIARLRRPNKQYPILLREINRIKGFYEQGGTTGDDPETTPSEE